MALPLVELVENAHRAAQARLGIVAALLASSAFPSSTSGKTVATDDWSTLAAEQVLELRQLSAQLMQSYYQFARWIETGYSLGAPLDGEGVRTGEDLRESFLARVRAANDLQDSSTELGRDLASALRGNKDHPLHRLAVDTSDLEGAALPDREVRADAFNFPRIENGNAARAAIKKMLQNAAQPDVRLARSLAGATTPEEILSATQDALRAAGDVGGGKADGLVMRAGRGLADYVHQRDKRIQMYARGTGSNPCAFCAMLASRGFIYWSAASATKTYRDGGLNSYHDNCHCFPIVRWVRTSELPAANQYFQDNWESVTEDYRGKEKLNAWRRWLNQKRRESRSGDRTNQNGVSQ